jgi:UDP-glucuronate 4-epimerase
MKILITGAAGFIGSHLSEALLHMHHEVLGIDNFDPFYDANQKKKNLESFSRHAGFSFEKLDIRKKNIFKKKVVSFSPDIIYHLAGRGGMPHSTKKPFLYIDEIIDGTVSVLEAARAAKVKTVVNASSSSVYGQSTSFPFIEDQPTDKPTAPYAASKKSSELFCYCYHHLYGFSVINARFFSVYGPAGRPDQIIYKLTHAIDTNMPIPWYIPEPVRDFTFVSDVVSALAAMTAIPDHSYHILNIGSSKPAAISEVIKEIEKVLNKKAIIEMKSTPAPVSDFVKTYADTKNAQKILHWKPSVTLSEGIQKFVQWYKTNEKTTK